MIEPRISDRGQCRLAAKGNSQACLPDHGNVIGAVADGNGHLRIKSEAVAGFDQSGSLDLGINDPTLDITGQSAVSHYKLIGNEPVKTNSLCNRRNKRCESA